MTLYELNKIEVQRGSFRLRVDHLRLQPGKLYTLEGDNGSGKSSLLQLLALLRPPQRGQMLFDGQAVSWQVAALRKLRRHITLVEQTPLLFTGTVEQNLAFGLKVRGIHGEHRKVRIEQALEATGLLGFNNRLARELSGGETRRVALARALALQPKLLLLDEPTANLDTSQIAALERFLVTLPSQDMSLVIATHDAGQPKRLGGETIALRDGTLEHRVRPVRQEEFNLLRRATT